MPDLNAGSLYEVSSTAVSRCAATAVCLCTAPAAALSGAAQHRHCQQALLSVLTAEQDDAENRPIHGPLQQGQTVPLLLTASASLPAPDHVASTPFSTAAPMFKMQRDDQVMDVRPAGLCAVQVMSCLLLGCSLLLAHQGAVCLPDSFSTALTRVVPVADVVCSADLPRHLFCTMWPAPTCRQRSKPRAVLAGRGCRHSLFCTAVSSSKLAALPATWSLVHTQQRAVQLCTCPGHLAAAEHKAGCRVQTGPRAWRGCATWATPAS